MPSGGWWETVDEHFGYKSVSLTLVKAIDFAMIQNIYVKCPLSRDEPILKPM